MKAADIAASQGIRNVDQGQARLLADITADAFRDDPFNNWLFASYKGMHRTFEVLARHVYGRDGCCQILEEDGEDQAAAMWMLPGGNLDTPLRALPALYGGLFFNGGLGALKRGKAAGEAMEAHHPSEPHAYLFTVGVKGTGRGRGLGRKLLAPVLDAADRTGTMIYLENSNPANRGFYNSLGFERIELFHPLPESPPLEAMQRKAGAAVSGQTG
ncbi:Acetyltransferase (GNAT) family protein [Parasphingorhabdus marina DSM 22363]|uniref:Acetyltransferase (GNAT) family protein n=1 Tax=Parasphingorhabdus marina DSM 22363 TaxID=1123272 RepID=A0A1N6EL18_9SPHN|nr:GNAT family N-acetyltransferase [Parasphingorhabdus marina]SIN83647.1 Acetyltransferase (GNAT) family protein [Parasphingorhabdus marina DSM 22363]